jgi:two-component system response regulator AgrA
LAGQKELFFFENKYASFQVPFSDILYFETTEISHKLRLICNCRLISFYGTLEEIEKMDHRFCQVHRSFVVNLTNIVEIDRPAGLIYFNHQQQCFISRRKLKITLRKLKEFNKSIDL